MGEPIETNPEILDEQRLDEAGEAIAAANDGADGDDSDLVESLDTVGAEEPTEAEASDEGTETEEKSAEASEDTKEGEAEAKGEPAAEAEPKAGEQALKWAEIRHRERKSKQMMAELDRRMADLETRRKDIDSLPDPRRDPIGYAEAVAGRSGMTRAQLLERLTGAELRDGEPDPLSEIASVRQELSELRAERAKETEAQQQVRQQQQQASEIDSAVAEVMSLHDPGFAKSSPDVAAQATERWPWVANAKPEAVKQELQWAASATYNRWQRNGELHLHDQAELMAEAADQVEQRMSGLFGSPPKTTEERETSEPETERGNPETAAASDGLGEQPKRKQPGLTNKDAAAGSATRRVLEGDDRLDYAAEALLG